MKRLFLCGLALLLASCEATAPTHGTTYDKIRNEVRQATEEPGSASPVPAAVNRALLPPLKATPPRAAGKAPEARFNLQVSEAPASQVFMAIGSDTPYSILVHPDVTGTLSVDLKDATVFEALNAIREIYGYDYKVEGKQIVILPLTLQNRVYNVNYLVGRRRGDSDLRVTSGSISNTTTSGATNLASPVTTGTTGRTLESSRVNTQTRADFWADLEDTVRTIVGCNMVEREERSLGSPSQSSLQGNAAVAAESVSNRGREGCEGGRSVVANPQSGVLVVRAMPAELRDVKSFLDASQDSVERQVVLEAKILEVELKDGYQAGINWAQQIESNGKRIVVGNASGDPPDNPGGFAAAPGAQALSTALGSLVTDSAFASATGIFGIALASDHFTGVIEFLQTQGNVNVLSSPRIATLNNQKAVLKVGTDEFFVTNVTSTTTTGTATTTTPTVSLQPFFSGIALDVTPQIDEGDHVILHVHPSVSTVTTVTKEVNLGEDVGTLILPLPSSDVSETDSVVRARGGQIVAIGGLMKHEMEEQRQDIPVLADIPYVGSLFRQTKQVARKKELVILLKPTLIQNDADWRRHIGETGQRMDEMDRGYSWGGRSRTFGVGAENPR
jgi:MSHA biogenesis protein MshL